VIAPTGLHHERYYHDRHWSAMLASTRSRPSSWPTSSRGSTPTTTAGRSSVGRRTGRVSSRSPARGRADPHRGESLRGGRRGPRPDRRPILTHCEGGAAAPLQARFLAERGVAPGHVVLSHVDKVSTGATSARSSPAGHGRVRPGLPLEAGQENGTLTLLGWAFEDGFGDRVVLGMDAARQGYWAVHGGSPGMACLLGDFAAAMAARGIGPAEQARLFVANPARAYAFAPTAG